jgi:hypothetical protein
MAGQLTQYGANRAVQAGVGQSVSAASGMYVALATAQPASPDTATLATFASNEISDSGYSRQAVTWSSPSGDPSQVSNSADITFGPFSGSPGTITHCFLCDAASGTSGNVLAYWTLDASKTPTAGESLKFATGDLTMSVD